MEDQPESLPENNTVSNQLIPPNPLPQGTPNKASTTNSFPFPNQTLSTILN